LSLEWIGSSCCEEDIVSGGKGCEVHTQGQLSGAFVAARRQLKE